MSTKAITITLLAVTLLVGCSREPAPLTAEQIARNNEGVALMGQYRNEDAREIFAALVEERPDRTDLRVNEAIATLNRQNEGDELRALSRSALRAAFSASSAARAARAVSIS